MLYFQSIIVYSLLALLMCYCAYCSQWMQHRTKLFDFLPVLFFTLVFGLRYGVGVDYNNYVNIYEDTVYYSSIVDILQNERYEAGFSILLFICHYFNFPVYILFSLIAFLQIFLIYKTFKNERNILLYIYATMFLTAIGMTSFMNIIRHMLAFCFFIYSLLYIRDNKLIKYWICCVLALAFHHSALLLFPLYFIWIRHKGLLHRPIIELCILLICVFISFFAKWQSIIHFFDDITILLGYQDYIEDAAEMFINSKFGITRIALLVINLIIILNSIKIKEYFKSDLLNILYDLFFVGTCLGYLFMGSMLLRRAIIYFSETQFILIAYALCYLYETRKQDVVQKLKYITTIICLFITYNAFIYNCTRNTGAYVSYFQEDMHPLKDELREEMLSRINN